MKGIHGGDIYRNHVVMDFSVNVNPLGVPKAVEAALHTAVGCCRNYPDIEAEKLKRAVAGMVNVPEEYLLMGNGASELFMAVVHGLKPEKTVIVTPSFYGYEYAAKAAKGETVYYATREEDDFCLDMDFLSALTKDVSLLFLANPNNPVGNLADKNEMRRILGRCRDKGIYVVLDECFIEFCGTGYSMMDELDEFPNVILVRAFTKIFSIPGVRLGYLACASRPLLKEIQMQLPEWNVSGFAQAAGCACALETKFIEETEAYLEKERPVLADGLRRLGLKVFPGRANFLLVSSSRPLYERLLEKGILIRDCGNFRGLAKGFYRIAVKSREENQTLLKTAEEVLWEE